MNAKGLINKKIQFFISLLIIFLFVVRSNLFLTLGYNIVFLDLAKNFLDHRGEPNKWGNKFIKSSIVEQLIPSKAKILRATWNTVTDQYSLDDSLLKEGIETQNRFVIAQCSLGYILIEKQISKSIILNTLDFPETAQCLFPYAQSLERNGHWEQAEEIYKIIITQQPNQVDARLALAEYMYLNGNKQEAAEQYEIINSLDPTSAGFYRLLQAYRLSGQIDKALKVAKEALELFPDDPWLKYEMAEIILLRTGEKEAINFLQGHINQDPTNARLRYILCRVYDEIDQAENAVNACKQSVLMDENYMPAYYWLSQMLLQQDRAQEALEYANVLLLSENIFGTRLEFLTYLNLGDIYSQLGETEQALSAYCKALKLNRWPDKTEYLNYQLSNIGRSCPLETEE